MTHFGIARSASTRGNPWLNERRKSSDLEYGGIFTAKNTEILHAGALGTEKASWPGYSRNRLAIKDGIQDLILPAHRCAWSLENAGRWPEPRRLRTIPPETTQPHPLPSLWSLGGVLRLNFLFPTGVRHQSTIQSNGSNSVKGQNEKSWPESPGQDPLIQPRTT